MTLPASSKPRYTLTYKRVGDPHFAATFELLHQAIMYWRRMLTTGDALEQFAAIYDRETNRRGKMFPSGRVRWNS